MDDSLYDEFGNFIGTVDSDAESQASQDDLDARADAYLQDEDEEQVADEQLMQVDGFFPLYPQLTLETPTNAIILHEDKQYYPSAEQIFGPDVEVLVQDEDTQPLTEPIVAPLKVKSFAVEEKDLPPVHYSREYMVQLTQLTDTVRNVALVGHLHHGKTGLIDLFVTQTHSIPPIRQTKEDSRLRYTDTHILERARGISIKSTPITLLLPNSKGKSHVFNFIDTPGHVNFSDEIAAAIRLVDGIALVVDVVEGVMANTEKIIRHAVAEGQHIVLVLNKMDRLILELKIPPADAYFKLRHTIEEVNTIIASCGSSQRLSPEIGNVVFSSAAQGWSFTLSSFARKYGELSGSGSWDEKAFAQRLWGDIFFNPTTRKFQRKQQDTEAVRGFVYFILEPLYKIYAQTIGEDAATLKKTLKSLKITIKDNVYKADARDLLKVVCQAFFGLSGGFVDAMLSHIPDPVTNAKVKAERMYTGPQDGVVGEAIRTCDPEGPLTVHVTKLYSSTDAKTFQAFGRVMSGTLRRGDQVRVLGEGYSLDDEEQSQDETVGDLYVPGGRYRVEVSEVKAGNLVLIDDVDKSIFKTATIVSKSQDEDAYIFRPISHFTQSVYKVAIEPTNPSDLPKMTAGLRSVSKSYPLLETRIEESGEHVLLGTGEIFVDCVLHDLRVLYAEIDIKVSDPVVRFCETVVETSALKCYAETPNKKYNSFHSNTNCRNKITMIAEPLDKGIAEDIESGRISIKQPVRILGKYFQEHYHWDLLASRNIWAFGPSDNGPNILVNDTLPSEVDRKLLGQIRESVNQGFQWATREGPLCDEPIRNVKFRLLDATIADQAIYRGGGQIIPTARRVAYSSFLTATPRLMEPIYSVEIQAPADCVSVVYTVLSKRRGHVVQDLPKAGSPLYTIKALIPVIDSVGFESDIRLSTQGQAFCQQMFDHWQIVPGDPLDTTQVVRPLEPAMAQQLARDFCIKTRRRKGLNVDVSATRYMDKEMVEAMQQLDLLAEGATGYS
jgi:116 kDa U5 small nuclear ribonucleoprotein component